jgi:hypothetical protein
MPVPQVRLGPLGSDAPFHVDLSLEGQQAAGATVGGGSSAGSAGSGSARVDLIRGLEGQLRVQVGMRGLAGCAAAVEWTYAGATVFWLS